MLVALVAASIWYVAGTASGLQWVAHQFSRKIGKTTITVEGVAGTLAGGFSARHVVIDYPRIHLDIENATGKLALLPLLWQSIRVPEVRAQKVTITVRHSDEISDNPHFLPALMSGTTPESIPAWFRQLAKNLLEPIPG